MSAKPFGIAVRDLLIDRGFVTGMGNPNWAAFALELPTIHYETLRKAVTGERVPAEKVMAEIAEALDVDPMEFVEYQLVQARKAFDPLEVGEDVALANLATWNEAKPAARPARTRRASGTATA